MRSACGRPRRCRRRRHMHHACIYTYEPARLSRMLSFLTHVSPGDACAGASTPMGLQRVLKLWWRGRTGVTQLDTPTQALARPRPTDS